MAQAAKIENQGKSYDADWELIDEREKAYRDALGDGLDIALGADAKTLSAIVEVLNERNVHGPKGQRWTVELLETELERIAR